MAYAQNIPTQPLGLPGRRSIRNALRVLAGLALLATATLGFNVMTYDEPSTEVQYPAPSPMDDLMASKQAAIAARTEVQYPAPSPMDDLMAAKQAANAARTEVVAPSSADALRAHAVIREWKRAVRQNPGTHGKAERFTLEG